MPAAELEAALLPYAPGVPFKTVRDYAQAYRSGATTPEEVAARVLAAIRASDAADPPLRAFIANDADDVLAQARAATARIRAGSPLSLLDGVPVAIKDEVDQTPYPTTVGTTFLGRQPAAEDATAVARLRAAGALLIGKANMHEIGINPNGANAHYGPARNPYDPALTPAAAPAGPPSPWRPASARCRSARTAAARSASRPACAAWSGSSRPSAASANTARRPRLERGAPGPDRRHGRGCGAGLRA